MSPARRFVVIVAGEVFFIGLIVLSTMIKDADLSMILFGFACLGAGYFGAGLYEDHRREKECISALEAQTTGRSTSNSGTWPTNEDDSCARPKPKKGQL